MTWTEIKARAAYARSQMKWWMWLADGLMMSGFVALVVWAI